jgi:opacity protein-like surface antigen
MRSVMSLVAAGAATLFSQAVFAADMAIAPPPYAAPVVKDFGGWYLRGDIGFSNQSVKNVRNGNEALYAPVTALTQTTGFDTGGTFQLGVGYQFNNWFRADITGQYRGRSNFHGTDIVRANAVASNIYPYSGVDDYNASKSELLFLGNAYVDLGTWWCVTPFIGAGIGASRVTISNFTDKSQVNTIYDPGTDTFGPGAQTGVAYAVAGSKWNFAWALHTGLAYKVGPGLTVELGYSYLNLGDGVTGAVTTFDGFTTNNTMRFKDITSHDLKLGVRWDLSNPPVYVPPPLIRKG